MKIPRQLHPLLIIAIPILPVCYWLFAHSPIWLIYVLLVGVLLATPLWWCGYKAIANHAQDARDREAFRDLLRAATDQARAGCNLELVDPRSGTTLKLSNPFPASVRQQQLLISNGQQPPQQQNELPTYVRYEEIRHKIPRGHILVGIGRHGVETKEKAVGACVWVVGLSGTGKTSTTVLRVEERANDGHNFMGVDPHWFKDDSLTNAVKPYEGRFLLPMARTPEESKTVLQAFLDEFNARKGGLRLKPWGPVTLLVDEVGSLMDATDALDKEIADILKRIARICGQEARDFLMGGIFISQQATGLAWLRKVALMVIVHQLLMQSEKELACNGDKAAAKDMETWPIGRTYVFGVGFQEGPRTVQQPYFRSGDNRVTGPLPPRYIPTTTPLLEPVPDAAMGPKSVPALGPDDVRFSPEQEQEFLRRWQKQRGPIKPILRQMGNGAGLSNRYAKYASWLLEREGLK